MLELYRKKNADYGNSFGRAWSKFGSTVGLVYMDAKINRALNLMKHPEFQQVHSESVDDTLMDLANYAVMTAVEMYNMRRRGLDTWLFNDGIEKIRKRAGIRNLLFEKDPMLLLSEIADHFEQDRVEVQANYDCTYEHEQILDYAMMAIVVKVLLDERKPKEEAESPTEAVRSGYVHVEPCEEVPEAEAATSTYEYTPEELDASDNWGVNIVLEEGGYTPVRSTEGAAGYDLFAPTNYVIMTGRNVVSLAFRMEIPRGVGATINSRSGFTLKGFEGYTNWDEKLEPIGSPQRLDADVQWGLIDSDYRGVVGVLVYSREQQPFLLARGTKFAQMCFQCYEDVDFHPVDRLSDTDRGEGGFNSTGTK